MVEYVVDSDMGTEKGFIGTMMKCKHQHNVFINNV